METKPDTRSEFKTPVEMQLQALTLRLHSDDNVAISKADLVPGTRLVSTSSPLPLVVGDPIPTGHKIALEPIAAGGAIRRYGQVIGHANQAIEPGQHVHVHNVSLDDFARKATVPGDLQPVEPLPRDQRRTFDGYLRDDGRVGTRNYIALISTTNCSAHVTRQIAYHFTPERLAAYPYVDGVVPFTHGTGCTCSAASQDHILLQRTLAGIARHANVGAYLLVGLGCETNQIASLVDGYQLDAGRQPGLVIQELGGSLRTIEAGIAAVETLLPEVNRAGRSAQPLSALRLALQCGGSDGWSGVTANPLVGLVSDEVVRQGGAVVLAETTEIYGAEHLLVQRAIRQEIAGKLLAHIAWWQTHARWVGMVLDHNRGIGNEAGGLTTIYEKSLGGIAKAGSSPLVDVVDYAQPVTAPGFSFMNTPGNDPISVTGQVAGGCNLVLFTTGRGSVSGFKPAPSIKIASNSDLFRRLPDDMDANAGRVLEGESFEQVAADLVDLVVATASGQPTKSETLGAGEAEFVPWSLGATL